jgi:hypothetical protein
MTVDSLDPPVEQFTISIEASDNRHGTLMMAWGTFRWTAPIVLDASLHPERRAAHDRTR